MKRFQWFFFLGLMVGMMAACDDSTTITVPSAGSAATPSVNAACAESKHLASGTKPTVQAGPTSS